MTEGPDNNEFSEGAPPPPRPTGGGGGGDHDGVVQDGKPAVASAPGKILILAILAIIFVFIVIKSLFFGYVRTGNDEKKHLPEKIVEEAAPPNFNPNQLPLNIPPVSPPPPPPPTPPPPQVFAPPPVTAPPVRPIDSTQLKARIHAPMLATNAAGKDAGAKDKDQAKKASSSDPNSAFAQSVGEGTTETVVATQVKNLNRTIIQGKFIHAVLETAIDSSLPAPIRAITSHDTYAESGREVLIPKGSRLIGVYNASIKRGQARVFIVWTRVVRPDGVDVAIDSPGVDALGRAGMGGEVDNKYFEAFSTAFLTSAIDIGIAGVGQSLFGNQDQLQTNGTNGTTVVTSPSSAALQTAIQNIGTVGQSIVGNAVNLQPVIHVDQGSEINVFVNKDVVFPADLLNPQIGVLP